MRFPMCATAPLNTAFAIEVAIGALWAQSF
jgi:hypothetical protein